jgi:signal transduction histidine kinase
MSEKVHALLKRINILVHSIRFRLALWFVAILAIILVIFSAFVYTRQKQDLQYQTVDRLELKIRQFQALDILSNPANFYGGQLNLPILPQDSAPLLNENEVLALTDLQGQVLQKMGPISSTSVNRLAQYALGRSSEEGAFTYSIVTATAPNSSSPNQYLFLVAPISFERHIIGFLILGSPVDPGGQLHRLLITLLLGTLFTLSIAMVGGYWLADKAMRPVKTITQAARQISETDLSRRLKLNSQDELGELADTFDQMLDRLQSAFERQRQFTADASHELRTPLTIVNLEASRALRSRRTSQEYERALTIIQSENEWMTRLVTNLLTLSRMDAGQAVLNLEEQDLSDLTLEVVERLMPLAQRHNVDLSTGNLPELKVQGDRQYLVQMINNLVENAIKYTKGEHKRVFVETGLNKNGEVPLAWVSVKDNGPGIAEEHLSHLFDRFYQVDQARTRNSQDSDERDLVDGESSGSGLGLSIVKWIAEAHAGEVRVQSEVGAGTCFEVLIPLITEKETNLKPVKAG